MSLFAVYSLFAFAMGACVASFLNVVVWRVPRGESIVSPPSHCPKCGAAIRWWQNLPIVSWLALRGRCSHCHAPISPRYLLVEALGGALYLAAFWHTFAPGAAASLFAIAELVTWWTWIALMIAGSFIDFGHQLLPDFVTVGGMALGLAFAAAETAIFLATTRVVPSGWWECSSRIAMSGVGLLAGLAIMGAIRWLGTKAFGREAMGMGDVLLMGAVGSLFGPVAVVFCLMLSALLGSVAGVGAMLLSKTRLGQFAAIPYGPYICMACLIWMFRGPQAIHWYLSLLKLTP